MGLLYFQFKVFFLLSIYDKHDSVRILIIGFVLFVCSEFPVYPIYDLWSNIEHAQGLFLTNKEKRLMTWTIGLGIDVLESEKKEQRGVEDK